MGGEDGTVDREQLIRQVTFLQKMVADGPPPVPTELNFNVKELPSLTPEDAADQILDQFDKNGEDGL